MNDQGKLKDNVTLAPVDGERIIDLRYLFPVILRWSWLIVLAMALAGAKGAVNMHNFQPQSVARMVLAPLASSGINSPGSSLGGGVSQLLGIGMGQAGRSATEFDRFVHATSTISLARRLQGKYGLLQVVYAKSWDSNAGTWVEPTGEEHQRTEKIQRYLNLRVWSSPDLEDLSRYIGGRFIVNDIDGTAFKEASFSHKEPELALWLLKIVYDEAVLMLRENSQRENLERQRYLEKRLAETSGLEARQALIALLASETNRAMMFHGDLPFVARIVEQPYLSKYKTQPNKLRLVFLPIILAFTASLSLITLVALFRSE